MEDDEKSFSNQRRYSFGRTALENSKAKLEGELKIEVESHLQILKEEYDCYFPGLGNVELTEWKCNSTVKDDFEAMSLNSFWAKYLHIYKNVGSVAIRTLLPFSSTYLCESGFSALVSMKTKFRNKLECEADLRCALSSTKPRVKRLVSQKQLHPSH